MDHHNEDSALWQMLDPATPEMWLAPTGVPFLRKMKVLLPKDIIRKLICYTKSLLDGQRGPQAPKSNKT